MLIRVQTVGFSSIAHLSLFPLIDRGTRGSKTSKNDFCGFIAKTVLWTIHSNRKMLLIMILIARTRNDTQRRIKGKIRRQGRRDLPIVSVSIISRSIGSMLTQMKDHRCRILYIGRHS